MNQEIKAYIIAQCKKQGMEPVPSSIISEQMYFGNEFAEVKVTPGHMDEMYFFEYWNVELSHELLFRFPIPETLRGFMQVCNLLKVFHNHFEPKFEKGKELIFQSSTLPKPRKVTFEEWCKDGVNCHVTFARLGYEKNVLSLVHSKFLSRP